MKLTMTIGAAMSIAALTGCSQNDQDNMSSDANAEMMANETVLPPDDGAGTDTLGNQLDRGDAGSRGHFRLPNGDPDDRRPGIDRQRHAVGLAR